MRTNYSIVRQGTKGLPVPALVDKARHCVRLIAADPLFANPTPALNEVTAACIALESAQQRADFTRGRLDIAERNRAHVKLRHLLVSLGAYVQTVSGGDAEVIGRAGFEVKKKRQPSLELPAPSGVDARRTTFPGHLFLRWDAVRNRKTYEVLVAIGDPSDPGAWRTLLFTSKPRCTVTAPEGSVMHYFRIRAHGALGAGPLSDLAAAKPL